MSIVFGIGINIAILNLLKSEKVIKINSLGYEIEILDKYGNKKEENDPRDDAIEVASAWLGNNRTLTPMNEYLTGEIVSILLCLAN